MAVFKRFYGRRIKPNDPNWALAKWWMEFSLEGKYILKSIPGARTKAQAERAENSVREDIYNRRFNRTVYSVEFTEFVENQYMPWATANKKSFADDKRRSKMLKKFFGKKNLREITPLEIEKLKASLLGKKTCRGTPRTGATVNRYLQLLSKIFSVAFENELVDSNPCSRVHKEWEGGKRERYLTDAEELELMKVLDTQLPFSRRRWWFRWEPD